MKAICFNFEIHQPFRLKRYRFFDIGHDHYYYDDFANDDIVTRIAHQSYIPAAETLLRMIEEGKGKFKASISLSGVALEQLQQYVPEFIDMLKKLADTRCVEFVAEPYAHSLASLIDPDEFRDQMLESCRTIESTFGVKPTVARNTEFIYDDEIAPQLAAMGFKGVLTEGAKHILGWKSPDYIYRAATAPNLRLLLRNAKLSEDIAVRFSDTSWNEYPLNADKYIDWIASTPEDEQIVNLFMNLETFGDHHPAQTGIFQFLEALPRFAEEKGLTFVTPSEAIAKIKPVGELSVLHPISGADEARDTTAWLGNDLQNEAFRKLYSVAERVRLCSDRKLKKDWQYLQGADHFFFMSTKNMADGLAHSMFSPYETPFQAFTNYMNVLADFIVRVEEQYPLTIENEELNALLTSIRNQEKEIETLNKELSSMRKNVEQYNVEHKHREPAKQPEDTPAEKPAPKTRRSAAKTAEKKGTKKTSARKAASKATDKE